jgi:hypothetical protein
VGSLQSIETPQRYNFKIINELLVQAKALNIDLEGFIGFLGAQVQAMLGCPPNYSKFGKKERAWIMRGFYPGTPLFFKLTIGTDTNSPSGGNQYNVKAVPLRVNKTVKGHQSEAYIWLDSAKINEDITNRMENEFFGANHELESLLDIHIKLPRCMSPRGCQMFRYDIPSPKKEKP